MFSREWRVFHRFSTSRGFFKLQCYGHRLEVLEQEQTVAVTVKCLRPGSGEESELGSRLPPALHLAVPIQHTQFCNG